MPTQDPQLQTHIGRRHSGLPNLAHGGYVAGVMANAVGGDTVEVRLKRPVPTGNTLTLERGDRGRVELRDGDMALAQARPATLSLDLPSPVSLAEAQAASRRFLGHEGRHPFPDCLVCGTGRAHGDGLHIFTGPVAGRPLVAGVWVPAPEHAPDGDRVSSELVWAALDCPQLWALIADAPPASNERAVTGGLTARIEHPVTVGEPHVVIGWPIGREDRTLLAGAAVLGPRGELCAIGRQVAVLTSWGVPLGRHHLQAPAAQAA